VVALQPGPALMLWASLLLAVALLAVVMLRPRAALLPEATLRLVARQWIGWWLLMLLPSEPLRPHPRSVPCRQ